MAENASHRPAQGGTPTPTRGGANRRSITFREDAVGGEEEQTSQVPQTPSRSALLLPKSGPLPRRSRSGIMNWLFGSFTARPEEGLSPPEGTTLQGTYSSSTLRGATSLFSITRISGGRLGGPPVFERKRRRHKTVVWKYKKSIGMFASFVFISNQILASGKEEEDT